MSLCLGVSATLWLRTSDKPFVKFFDALFDLGHELIRDSAIDEPMVVAERQVAHHANADHVVDDHRTFLDGADAEDRHLRLIDDRQSELRTEVAQVSDRAGAL